MLYGHPKGAPGGTAAVFPVIDGSVYERGLVDQFFDLRDQIVASDGYTVAIGEDLGIIGPESSNVVPADTAPDLRSITTNGNTVNISGSMQGMTVMRVEYAAKGQTYSSVAVITNLPATFTIAKTSPTAPEVGTIRSIFMKMNADFGMYSPNYNETLA